MKFKIGDKIKIRKGQRLEIQEPLRNEIFTISQLHINDGTYWKDNRVEHEGLGGLGGFGLFDFVCFADDEIELADRQLMLFEL